MNGDLEFSRIYFSSFKLLKSALSLTYSFLMTFIAYFVYALSKREIFLEARSTFEKCPRPSMLKILKSEILSFGIPFAILAYDDCCLSLFSKSFFIFLFFEIFEDAACVETDIVEILFRLFIELYYL